MAGRQRGTQAAPCLPAYSFDQQLHAVCKLCAFFKCLETAGEGDRPFGSPSHPNKPGPQQEPAERPWVGLTQGERSVEIN